MNLVLALSSAYLSYNLVQIILNTMYSNTIRFKKRFAEIEEQNLLSYRSDKDKEKSRKSIKIDVPEKLKDMLAMAGILLRPEEFLIMWILSALIPSILMIILGKGFLLGIIFLLLGGSIPPIILQLKKQQRLDKFNNQLGDALLIISNSLRAGFTFEQALSSISRDLPDPIGTEFTNIVREVELGERLEKSMQDVAERMGSDDMELINTAVSIQRQVGGNLSNILDNIGNTIRDRITMKKKIKALTAQGEISGKVIGALPIILLVLISFVNPEYMEPLYTTTFGYVLLGLALFLEVIGYITIKKLVNIDF